MSDIIKFAGLSMGWKEFYAYMYKDKLIEMGQPARVVKYSANFYVAYSYETFTLAGALITLEKLLEE